MCNDFMYARAITKIDKNSNDKPFVISMNRKDYVIMICHINCVLDQNTKKILIKYVFVSFNLFLKEHSI